MRAVFIAAVLIVSACGKKDGAPAASQDPRATGATDAAPPAPAPRIYLFGGGNTLTVGDAAGYRRLGDKADQFFSVVPAPDGTAWIGTQAGLRRFDGATIVEVETPGLDQVSPVATTPDGSLWALAGDRIARRDAASGAWASWTLAEAGASGVGRLHTLGAGLDGTAYVPAGPELLIGDGKTWRTVAAPAGAVIVSVAIAADGRVYASTGPQARAAKPTGAVHEVRDGALVHLADTDYAEPILHPQPDGSVLAFLADVTIRAGAVSPVAPRTSAIDADGTQWTMDRDLTAVIAVGADGNRTRYPAKGPFEGRVSSIAVERGGRVWILLDRGLAVVEGGELASLPPGTLDGVPAKVQRIVLAGDAIALPPFPAAKRITLRGRFVGPDQAPRAGVRVELCRDLSLVYAGKTPCADKQPAWRATTAADGTFELPDLPAGGWTIAYASRGQDWAVRTKFTWNDHGDVRQLDDFVLER